MALLFLYKHEVLALHQQLIEQFGGITGLRDEGALESALAAPLQRAHYEEADLVVCAATYAYHLSQAHAFLDGNKRVAAAAAELFIELNGARLNATDDQLIDLFLRLASGELRRDDVEERLRHWIA
jgi:death-on-curing protein